MRTIEVDYLYTQIVLERAEAAAAATSGAPGPARPRQTETTRTTRARPRTRDPSLPVLYVLLPLPSSTHFLC